MSDVKLQNLLGIALLLVVPVNCNLPSNDANVVSYSEENCKNLLTNYALMTANFTQCFVQNARPITVCQRCISNYVQVYESYTNITKLKTCRLTLLNVDTLNAIEGNHKYVSEQWKLAKCHKCFEQNETVLNSKTQKILGFLGDVRDCIRTHENGSTICNATSSVCTDCVDYYVRLNDLYDNNDSYNGFCMDIVDMMNATRYNWSTQLCCCTDRRTREPLYLVFYSGFLLLPVIFYFALWYRSTSAPCDITYHYRWTDRRASFSQRQS